MGPLAEFLRWELTPGSAVSLVLRSGARIDGLLEKVDLVDHVILVDGWAVRIDEVAGARAA